MSTFYFKFGLLCELVYLSVALKLPKNFKLPVHKVIFGDYGNLFACLLSSFVVALFAYWLTKGTAKGIDDNKYKSGMSSP